MEAEERREKIAAALSEADAPVSASSLAGRLGVSRQVIVGDVALLRASGREIIATPRGYVMGGAPRGSVRTVACVHTLERMEEELNIMVDNGCTVLDVVVEHPVYGQLTGELRISSRYDVRRFCLRLADGGANMLSDLTGGVHLHTLSCPDEESYERTLRELDAAGLLLK